MDLNSSVSELPFVGPTYLSRLEKLGIKKIKNLLLHIPHRYEDYRYATSIRNVRVGESVTIRGGLISIKNIYTKTKKVMQEAIVRDETGEISVTWFNQPYLVKSLHEGDILSLSGKVGFWGRKVALVSPKYEKALGQGNIHTGRLVPIYSETSGLSSKWLRRQIRIAYQNTKGKWEEFLPQRTLTKLNLIKLPDAIKSVHFPESPEEAETARERLAFDELLLLQMSALYKKRVWMETISAHKLLINKKEIDSFVSSLPFELTNAQKRVKAEILNDFTKEFPMNRLLEGDVGSGKTVIAAIGAFVSFLNGYQSVIMAPTQILANQHFETLKTLLSPFKVRVKLITSAGTKGDSGRADVFVGTHALIHNKVDFAKVAFVVIDEQHRFGVEQRAHLTEKSAKGNKSPHLLTMTATPIPRTVALTFYGDLDLSVLDEMPKERKMITTWVVPPQKRNGAYKWISSQISNLMSQVFIVCPLIEASDKETMKDVKSAKVEYAKIVKLFPSFAIGLLHGKLKTMEKEKVIKEFSEGKVDILVATPVVEVGIDIPKATIMVIEAADRFGLAQLHQLRGRVGRSDRKSYCLLFSEAPSQKAEDRLLAMTRNISGFELSELDLKLRGPGEVFGTAQSGFPELKIANWRDIGLIKKSKRVAEEAFEKPEKYKNLHKSYQTDFNPNQ